MNSFLKKLWHFIWEEDSVWSWIANIILAFVLIKFVLYPGLGALLGTPFPIVAVVSSSMEHSGSFEAWWSGEFDCRNGANIRQSEYYVRFGITQDDFADYMFTNGFNKGDIMVLINPEPVEVGQVVVYTSSNNALRYPIIHRVVSIKDDSLITKGDNNCKEDPIIQKKDLVGKAVLRIPLLGYVKIWFVQLLCLVQGSCAI